MYKDKSIEAKKTDCQKKFEKNRKLKNDKHKAKRRKEVKKITRNRGNWKHRRGKWFRNRWINNG